jgi:hypothetical protein
MMIDFKSVATIRGNLTVHVEILSVFLSFCKVRAQQPVQRATRNLRNFQEENSRPPVALAVAYSLYPLSNPALHSIDNIDPPETRELSLQWRMSHFPSYRGVHTVSQS